MDKAQHDSVRWLGMKLAQDLSAFSTLGDIYAAVQNDFRISSAQRLQILDRLDAETNQAPLGTRLSTLMQRGLGGILGALIAKYFGLGGVGQAAAPLVGMGIAPMIGRSLMPTASPYPGYKLL